MFNQENNISDCNYHPSKPNVTEEIDFVYNNIYKFDHENNLNS